MATLFLFGAGNSEGVRLAMILQQHGAEWDRIVLLDDDPALLGFERIGVPVVGDMNALKDADPSCDRVANLVARRTSVRALVGERLRGFGVPFVPLIHPNVDILGADLDDDVIVYQNATIGPEVKLGAGACVFMGAVVGHECVVGEACVMAANSVLNARVILEEQVYIGTNSTVLPEIRIGRQATVGAGSVVVHDVDAEQTAVGVPAEIVSVQPSLAAAPESDADLRVALHQLWAKVLGREDLDETKTFFDQGGDSLGALRVRNRLRTELGLEVPIVTLFQYPTLNALHAFLADSGGSDGAERGREVAAHRKAAMARRRVRRA